ncbi:MAG: ABC transporter ATP-binding protein [Thermoanaerobacteraceae bacterium]|nr:ABC transporter ATP-binding protein [Thermoanaerobacteraceae bacterium]
MAVLEARQITAGYGDTVIVEQITVQVDAGQTVAVVGPNGSGKSTFLKSLVGLVHRFAGSVIYQGRDITVLQPWQITRSGIGYVPQVQNIFPNLSVTENLEMGAYSRRDKEGIRGDLNEIFTIFPELQRRRRTRAETLSGGERQLLAIGRALMGRPQMLLLDEPLAFLAPKAAALILEKLAAVKEKGIGVLLVEQNTFLALKAADYAYVLSEGRCVMEGKGSVLLEDASLRERFLGLGREV